MSRRLLPFALLAVLTACDPGPEAIVEDEALLEDEEAFDDVFEMGEVHSDAQALTGTQVIYVNFGGVKICDASGEDATKNKSFAVCGHFGVCGGCKTFAAYTTTAHHKPIVDQLRKYFAAYDVRFTTSRPTSGPYTMLVVSPTTGSNHGVAALDCGNRNPNGIAFVYKTGSSFYTNI
ncbi:MAG: hypothetical protein ACK4N5_03245, partial [Myxococcales bacterium]